MKGKNVKFSWCCTVWETPQLCLEQTYFIFQRLNLIALFPVFKNIFTVTDQFEFFLLLGWAVTFWWMCLKIALYLLFGQPEFCFNFNLKKKHRFSIRSFAENALFISFHEGIWSRYSEINKFKTSKDLSFQKLQKHTKICRFQRQVWRGCCSTGYSL